MSGYPIILTGLAGCHSVVVGGGAVAARKAAALVEAGARPVVIGPEIDPALEEMATAGQVEVFRRLYREGDLAGAAIVIAATDDREVNAAVSAEARRWGIPVNVVDDPELCTFTVPAVVRRGDLLVAISTGGGSPALARHLREMLETAVDDAYGDLLAILAELRPRVQREVPLAARPAVWDRLLDGGILACLRTEGVDAARELAWLIVESYAVGIG